MLIPLVALLALAASDPASWSALGPGYAASVAIAGDLVLVGQSRATASPPAAMGGVHVFRRVGDAWTEVGTFAAGDTELGDGFGAALAADGATLAVGAPRAADGAGAVYLFTRRPDGTWGEVARLVLPDGRPGDLLGAALALRGNLLLAGAPGRDSAAGAAYAFRRRDEGWGAGSRIAPGFEPGDRFGSALAIAGEQVVVGAPGPLGGQGGRGSLVRAGFAAVFRPVAGDQWAEVGRLLPGTDTVRALGAAVAARDDAIFVGAPLANASTGMVYEFRREGSGWELADRLVPAGAGGGTRFGLVLALAGDELLASAPGAPQHPGAVSVFSRQSGRWVERQTLGAGGTLPDGFGAGVAAGPSLLVVAAPGADFGEGAAHAFRRGADGWSPAGALLDQPKGLRAIVGGEVQCGGSGEAGGFKCRDVDLLAFLPASALGARRGIRLNDLWGWTDPETGREYALVGRMDGTAFVDVTDPSRPVYLGELPMHQGARANIWRDIKVYRNHAFIVADGAGPHGMQVFDLTQLRRVAHPPVTFTETAHYDRIASAHNIAINEATGFAYPIGNSGGGETCGGALHMIDIRDPRHPTFAGCFADPATGFARTGYTHDAQCVTYQGPDARFAGREICFNASENALGIADVTDKANPKPIASAAYPGVSYAHQGWLSDDMRYFYLDDEGDEIAGRASSTRTLVWDVAKLDEPVLAREFLGTTAASDHNLYVKGRYVFQSNYVAGLRILDVADPTHPVEVGYFDTVPTGENVPGFDGSWSNYPYFRSGTIAVTSVREGLFLVRHRPRQPVP